MLQAKIFFDATEDSYEEGELPGNYGASWNETLTAETAAELKTKIADACYQKDFTTIEQDDANEYPEATEYWTSYLADENNEGDASESQIEAWKRGELRLWAIHCHILVSQVTEAKVTL